MIDLKSISAYWTIDKHIYIDLSAVLKKIELACFACLKAVKWNSLTWASNVGVVLYRDGGCWNVSTYVSLAFCDIFVNEQIKDSLQDHVMCVI